MSIKTVSVWLTSVVLLGITYADARADVPGDRAVYYYLRERPADPASDVAFVVRLDLAVAEAHGDWIGWQITSAELRRPDNNESLGDVWVDRSPRVDSPDGLWWVEHSDATTTQPSEFMTPPPLAGTASAVDLRAGDLNYDLADADYAALPEAVPYEEADPLPFFEGENEVAEGDAEEPPAPGKDDADEPTPEEPVVDVPNGVNDPG